MFFWHPHEENGCFSNWSKHSIQVEEKTFPTTEHYFMFHKALSMDDQTTANRILRAKTPSEVKSLGRQVKNFNEKLWVENREKIMFNALLLKAKQYPLIKEKLLETCGKVIVEASPYDTVWGIGLNKESEKSNHPECWKGKNLLGKAWMKVREVLLDSV